MRSWTGWTGGRPGVARTRSRPRSHPCRPASRVDWVQIAALYSELTDLTGSPVVRLNSAVAVAEVDGPAAALALVDGLDLAGYQYWHSTRAELLRRLGRTEEASAAYAGALKLARTEPERRFLEKRIAELSPS